MYSAYEVNIFAEGKPRKVTGNWAAVMNTIYDAIGEDAARRCATVLGEVQAEMFFGQDVDKAIIDNENKYRINIRTVKPRNHTLEEWID